MRATPRKREGDNEDRQAESIHADGVLREK
jgi:hypothetical protein